MKDFKVKDIELDDLNDDTFIEGYSVNNVNNVLKKITLLYKEKHVYDIQSIVGILNEYGYNHDNIIYQAMEEMLSKSNGRRTIPQIFFDDHHVGGYQELRALEKSGEIKELIK